MSDLLSNISPPTIRNIFIAIVTAIIGVIAYLIKEKLKKPTKVIIDDPIKLNIPENLLNKIAEKIAKGIASEDDLRKRVDKLEQEQGKSLPKEKIESCFIPGVKELEAGKSLLQYGQEAKARYHLEEAIKFFICAADALPCYETFYNLAQAYDDYCDYENAKENYLEAIQHDPTQPGGYNGLGVVYHHTSDYPKAENYLQQALAKAEKLADNQARLVWQANALGNLG